MPDNSQKDETNSGPAQPKYSDLNFTGAKRQPATGYVFDEKDYIVSNNKYLESIDKHLNSIRGILQFFVAMIILSIILGGCSILFG